MLSACRRWGGGWLSARLVFDQKVAAACPGCVPLESMWLCGGFAAWGPVAFVGSACMPSCRCVLRWHAQVSPIPTPLHSGTVQSANHTSKCS
eukprot:4313774-Alexandrium_andersonii.AAC.1